MEKDLLTTLKRLKKIEPDQDYVKASKMFILAHRQNPIITPVKNEFFGLLRLSTVVAVMAFAVFTLLRGVFYINTTYSPLALDGLNQNSLSSEADEINESIQNTLSEINKLDQSNRTAIETMNELSKSADFRVLSATSTLAPENATSTDMRAASTAIEDVSSYLINNPTATSTDSENKEDIDSMLDKASQ